MARVKVGHSYVMFRVRVSPAEGSCASRRQEPITREGRLSEGIVGVGENVRGWGG